MIVNLNYLDDVILAICDSRRGRLTFISGRGTVRNVITRRVPVVRRGGRGAVSGFTEIGGILAIGRDLERYSY